MTSVRIVQLPFPSTHTPQKDLVRYYERYERRFADQFPQFFVPDSDLWEMPLWVAHVTALLDECGAESVFHDLTGVAQVDGCIEQLLAVSRAGDILMFSPLAQNFDLAIEVSRRLMAAGRHTVLGGNMAPLATPAEATSIFRGQLTPQRLQRLLGQKVPSVLEHVPEHGVARDRITWSPNYRHIEGYSGRVPLLRLNASHGCLYACGFCGDAWSQQLIMVARDALAAEVDQLAERFPETKLVYIGDKTFGQSREAVQNLLEVFRSRPGYQFIVQTHVLAARPWVIEAMQELGVIAVEMGFESADTDMLRESGKISKGLVHYSDRLSEFVDNDIKVVLNVMGGLANETEASHAATAGWLRDAGELVWLANLYNFVPYPLIPDFGKIKPRIFDWDYAHWREDAPVVFDPFHVKPERSWEMFLEKVEVMADLIGSEGEVSNA